MQAGTNCLKPYWLLMKQNGWIIWQVQPRFPGWRMLVSVLASLWQSFCHLQSSPSFTPISGPGPACSELSREKEQVFDKSYVEIVLFDNNNMSTEHCLPSVCLCLLISRCQPWPQDKVTLLQISWHHNWTTNNIPSLALLFDRLLQGFQNC